MATYTRPTAIDSDAVSWYDSDTDVIRMTSSLGISDVIENVTINNSTTGTINFDALTQAIIFFDDSQAANRTINFRGDATKSLDSVMVAGESMTFATLMREGTTAYYLNAYQIDSAAVTPKWQGGTAPSAGNASSIDAYAFTIVKTGTSTFTVLASQTQFG